MRVPNEALAYYACMLVIGIVIPVVVSLIYVKVKKEKITTILIGALTFGAFAIFLESIPKAILFQIPGPISTFFMNTPWALVIVGASLAGIFEETGRFVAFKTLLRKRKQRTTAIAHGLGHGLFEVMYLFVLTGIQMIAYGVLINTGAFNAIIEQVAAAAPDQLAQIEALPEIISSVHFSTMPLALVERVGAVLFHVAMSIVGFAAVNTKRTWMFPLAIVLHTCLDIIAGLGQVGVITNVYIMELLIVSAGVVAFACAYLVVYKKLETGNEEMKVEQS